MQQERSQTGSFSNTNNEGIPTHLFGVLISAIFAATRNATQRQGTTTSDARAAPFPVVFSDEIKMSTSEDAKSGKDDTRDDTNEEGSPSNTRAYCEADLIRVCSMLRQLVHLTHPSSWALSQQREVAEKKQQQMPASGSDTETQERTSKQPLSLPVAMRDIVESADSGEVERALLLLHTLVSLTPADVKCLKERNQSGVLISTKRVRPRSRPGTPEKAEESEGTAKEMLLLVSIATYTCGLIANLATLDGLHSRLPVNTFWITALLCAQRHRERRHVLSFTLTVLGNVALAPQLQISREDCATLCALACGAYEAPSVVAAWAGTLCNVTAAHVEAVPFLIEAGAVPIAEQLLLHLGREERVATRCLHFLCNLAETVVV